MIHLDAKTAYSFMRGFGQPEQWYERCKEVGASALGICDYASTWGHVPFRAVFHDIKLLYGVQIPVCRSLDKDPRHALVSLLAKQDVSVIYEALSLAHRQTYYRPRLTWQQIQSLLADCYVLVNECAIIDVEYITKDMYLALGPRDSILHDMRDDYKCVATGSPVYPRHSDREDFGLVQAISEGARIGEARGGGSFLMREEEYRSTLKNLGIEAKDEWFSNAHDIVVGCTASIPNAELPDIVGPSLDVLARQGAENRKCDISDGPYADRLRKELALINSRGFAPYFQFVADLVTWARARMLVGPARGSSGGSLLCYLLGITDVDPLVHGLLFERFLDEGRRDLPDIDVDFPDQSRDSVFSYLQTRYGEGHVARLGTISRLGGKSAINDTCRAYQVPFVANRDVSKAVEGYASLRDFFAKPPEHLEPILNEYPAIRKAAALDGVPRHTGKHAAGVCVSKTPTSQFGAVDRNGIISLDLHAAEAVGMLKMDALGLRTLSVLQDACDQIGVSYRSLVDLSLDDSDVFEIFNEDRVTGVFQFEGHAVRGLMKQMTVEKFDDLCALTSLARPGPLVGGAAKNYVERRAGNTVWDFAHPALAAHTADTYGTIVYQEQAMSIVKDIGGFAPADVNGFRKAVGKKDPVKLAGYRAAFVEHARDIIGDVADDLWDEMCEFGSYAFNKSHAVAYSMLSYWCAWFKRHHPLEFCLAQLRNGADDDLIKGLLREIADTGYKYIPFDPQLSDVEWSIQKGKLVGGFTSVKGIGRKTAEKMVELRTAVGPTWLVELTEAQRAKLVAPNNTPWHDLDRFSRTYKALYDEPLSYRSESLPRGAAGPVYRIRDIPDEKGTYTFLGVLKRRQLREKKGGDGQTVGEFCNVFFEDDSGEIAGTISTKKWSNFKWLIEAGYDGKDFIVKATDINGDGRKWLFIDNLIPLDGKVEDG